MSDGRRLCLPTLLLYCSLFGSLLLNTVGMTLVKLSKNEESGAPFIERRRAGLERQGGEGWDGEGGVGW